MSNTELFNRVTIKDQDYIIQKFDARTGLKLARLIMAKAQPLIPLLAEQKDGPSAMGTYDAVFAILGHLTDEDIDALVDKCLRVCYVSDDINGLTPIMDRAGNYNIGGVEYDLALTLMLCFEAIKWGASDFFGEKSSALKGILGQLGLSQNQ